MDFFMGSRQEYEQKLEKKAEELGIKIEEKPEEKIDMQAIESITDDILKILDRTILKHSIEEVYVCQNIDHIDKFYNGNEEKEDDLIKEARKIKRLYKTYPEYLDAVSVYNEYMGRVIEKNGGVDIFRTKYKTGFIEDWLPPKPIYYTESTDYDMARAGIVIHTIMDEYDLDYDWFCELLRERVENLDVDELGMEDTILVKDYVLDIIGEKEHTLNKPKDGRVNVSDLRELQALLDSWSAEKTVDDKETKSQIKPFTKTRKYKEAEYNLGTAIDLSGQYEEVMKEADEVEEEDLDAMVTDSRTYRSMTIGEKKAREVDEFLDSVGWDKLKLLARSQYATKTELNRLRKRQTNKKKREEQADGLLDSIFTGKNMEYVSTTDQLMNLLYEEGDNGWD